MSVRSSEAPPIIGSSAAFCTGKIYEYQGTSRTCYVTMRFKSRYLLCELVLEDPRMRQNISQGMIVYNVREALARTHGDFGSAACAMSLSVKYLNAYTGIILLRCSKAFYQLLWSSLPFITSLENRGQRFPCFFNTLHVGGTIRTCQKFLIRYNKRQLHRLLNSCTSAEERKAIEQSIASCTLQIVEESEFVMGGDDYSME